MEIHWNLLHPLLVCSLIFGLLFNRGVPAESVEYASTYIVHMDKSVIPCQFSNHEHWYRSLVYSVKGVSDDQNPHIEDFYHYTYDIVIHGFSAKLTQSELDVLEEMPGHLLSFPDPVGKPHTTHSSEFLGLTPNVGLLPISRFGQDVIIAVLDTGIWPESQSFLDNGMEAVPARWKGTCENGTAFHPSLCNKKLIGARYFNKGAVAKYGDIDPTQDYNSPRDYHGHGSHTSSTAAGNYVDDVNYYGYAPGTARGVAPAGRIAMYKCVWETGSIAAFGSDVLAGMVSAISDGADVLSLSLGFPHTHYFSEDVIALGAFAAIKSGILVVCSAGNDGPSRNSIYNGAPWIFTVGASTIDRDYTATLTLGDGEVVNGSSFYTGSNSNKSAMIPRAPLFYDNGDPACKKRHDPVKVNGTVVLCVNPSYVSVESAKAAGVLGFIFVGVDIFNYTKYPQNQFPIVILKPEDEAGVSTIEIYASTKPNPAVDIQFGGTALGYKPAPAMADFSSRGPNNQTSKILKPDVTAPGVNIIAAWVPSTSRGGKYAINSGTSISCPHVAGLSALVKAVHREWSPAAIRSAVMTTSYTLDNTNNTITDLGNNGRPATPLEFGAGHVDPQKAVDPGLVYDVGAEVYFNFLCTLNYTTQQIQIISGTPVSCSTGPDLGADALNYPSFTAIFNKNVSSSSSRTFKRTLTNVGDDMSYYKAVVKAPEGLKIEVNPATLEFTEKLQKLNFSVTVEAEESVKYVVYGYLSWIDNKGHVVKSPVVALFE